MLVGLSEVVSLDQMQLRSQTDPRVVEDYRRAMQAGAVFPPVKVAHVNGAMLLVDGFHRIAALRALHVDHVEAEVVPATSLEEARWEAAKANLAHGLRLKRGERRGVFRAYVQARRHRHEGRRRGRLKSYREMAADLPGFPHTSLRNWMRQDFPAVFMALAGGEEKAVARGGLPPARKPEVALAEEAAQALAAASAALAGVTDADLRAELLEQVEALRASFTDGAQT